MPRRTHVIQFAGRVLGRDRHDVRHEGYHESAEPTLCGQYDADWVLQVGPGRWHGEAVFAACMAAITSSHQFTAFLGDVIDRICDGGNS